MFPVSTLAKFSMWLDMNSSKPTQTQGTLWAEIWRHEAVNTAQFPSCETAAALAEDLGTWDSGLRRHFLSARDALPRVNGVQPLPAQLADPKSVSLAMPAISWWVSNLVSGCDDPAGPCPAADALLGWLNANSDIVDTLILRCGVFTCCRTGCGECGGTLNASRCGKPAGTCENGGGVGGTISGKVSAACHRVLPKLHALGVRAELWLGNDDSLVSARHLLQRPNETATALLDLARQNSNIAGFNIDLEAGGGTVADGLLHRAFLEQVRGTLSQAGGLRLSSDVACSNFAGILGRPLASNCSLLGDANLHGGRIMNMATYDA